MGLQGIADTLGLDLFHGGVSRIITNKKCLGTGFYPKVVDEEVFNKELFMKLSPTSDDIWFWTMAVKKDTKIKVVKDNMYLFHLLIYLY